MASGFAITLTFGGEDDNSGLMFHVSIPWIMSLFVTIGGVVKMSQPRKTGVAIHNGSLWLYPLAKEWDYSRCDPWWSHHHAFSFPWEMRWHSTEILQHERLGPNMKVVWREDRFNRKPGLLNFIERDTAAESVSREYPYYYILKNRQVQKVTAKVHVNRMTWRSRLYPLIPVSRTRTSIDVKFDKEVGEGTSSWKGGVIGCSHEMKWGETPQRTLERMEHEREFRR